MNDASVLIYSCDAYADIWQPFFTLLFRYWDCPYDVYVATESLDCNLIGVEALHGTGSWTDRMRQAVEQIPTRYVIGMCEDMFLRREVKQYVIDNCIITMDENPYIACMNFEKEYQSIEPCDVFGFGRKPDNGDYRLSCQPTLWRRSVLLDLLDKPMSAWSWEMSSAQAPNQYDYLIWTDDDDDLVFEYGYHNNQWFGIRKGQWVGRDVVPLFQKEGIEVDFKKRGLIW